MLKGGDKMQIIKDVKVGVLFGVIGFGLTSLFWYLTTNTFDWKFPAVIGAGFFGGLLGSIMRRLHKSGEERKAFALSSIIWVPLIIIHVYEILTGNWKTWNFLFVFCGVLFLTSYAMSTFKSEKKWMNGFLGFIGFLGFKAFSSHNPWYLFYF